MQFPKDFVWGAATASFQIEGAAWTDGRGESIWDHFCRLPGRVAKGDTGDVACDHYNRFGEDVDLMAWMGLQSYRFSVAWPRIYPNGEGPVNQKGIDFYKRLVEKLLSKGITPCVTLYHWDLPQELQYKGGWTNRDVAYRFAEYAETMYRALGDVVPQWSTHNEPFCAALLGYGSGEHAPGYRDWPAAIRASHHLLLSHGLAVDAFRALGLKGQVGLTLNATVPYPATDSEMDRWAAHRMDGWHNRWFFDPVFKGAYPADMLEYYSQTMPFDYVLPGDLEVISRPIDFLGINYYTRAVVKYDPESPWLGGVGSVPKTAPVTDQDWEIVPDSLYDLLTRIGREWTGDLPLYMHENGCAMPDKLVDGKVEDTGRIAFLQAHFERCHKAMQDGVNLKGFFVWSLLDNFEWAWGYEKRFGLIWVDYASLARVPKASAWWYRSVIAAGGVEPTPQEVVKGQ